MLNIEKFVWTREPKEYKITPNRVDRISYEGIGSAYVI